MNFGEAVKSVLTKYAVFKGRARRSEYWYFYLFTVLVSILISIISCGSDKVGTVLSIVVSLALLLPGLGVAIRRLHDIGKSGWCLLIGLIPLVGSIILIVWNCKDSEPQANIYGPNPKDPSGFVPETPSV